MPRFQTFSLHHVADMLHQTLSHKEASKYSQAYQLLCRATNSNVSFYVQMHINPTINLQYWAELPSISDKSLVEIGHGLLLGHRKTTVRPHCVPSGLIGFNAGFPALPSGNLTVSYGT